MTFEINYTILEKPKITLKVNVRARKFPFWCKNIAYLNRFCALIRNYLSVLGSRCGSCFLRIIYLRRYKQSRSTVPSCSKVTFLHDKKILIMLKGSSVVVNILEYLQ